MRWIPGRTVGVALAVGIALTGFTGCGGAEDAAGGPGAELTAAELGELGGRIYVEPGRAGDLLAERELTREEFEARIREISAHPEDARAYTESFDAVVAESGLDVDGGIGTVGAGASGS